MISASESASESTTEARPTSKFSLPPPCSYEELYSSYQNEWDLQKKNTVSNVLGNETVTDLNIDTNVSGLEWVTLPSANGDESDTYLLACTGSGEIFVWKLAQSTGDKEKTDTDSVLLLEKHARCKICHGSADEDGMNWDEANETDHSALNGICLVKVDADDSGTSTGKTQRGKKRQRPSDASEMQDSFLLMVTGEGGLWSIPLLDVLAQPWGESVSTNSQQLPASLVRLSNRPTLKIQVCQSTFENETRGSQRLIALERDTNALAIWNLSTVLERHATGSSEKIQACDGKIDLSRIFSSAFSNTAGPKKHRRIKNKAGCTERATTMSILSSIGKNKDSDNSSSMLLVGTDRSKLWILHLTNGGTLANGPEPYSLSLLEEKKSSSIESSAKNNSSRTIHNDTDATTAWKVVDILTTNDGTWWTVAAVAGKKGNRSKATNANGLLITWHASTGMVVARQETREAIAAIQQHNQLYSTANEGAVTVWDSTFGLKRMGRFWTSPPSSKALAILTDYKSRGQTIMVVAGVGEKVDLFVDQCRVQTARI